MKFMFFIAVLANLLLFLWEVQKGAFDTMPEQSIGGSQSEKQILLVSELAEEQRKNSSVVVVEHTDVLITVEEEIKNEEAIILAEQNADGSDETKEIKQAQETIDMLVNQGSIEVLESIEAKQHNASEEKEPQENSVADAEVLITAELKTVGVDDSEVITEMLVIDEKSKNILESIDDKGQEEYSNEETQGISGTEADASLMSEQETENANDSEIVAEVDEKILLCYEIGPFKNMKILSAWLKDNNIAADNSERIYKKQQVVSTYLVYYPAAETYAESWENQKILKEKGITDLWLFRKGGMKGAISLGLFSKKQRAVKFVNHLVEKGIYAEWKERFKNEKSLFARVSMQGNPADLSPPLTAAVCVE